MGFGSHAFARTAAGAVCLWSFASACTVEPRVQGPSIVAQHCGDLRGDETCRATFDERPYCSGCVGTQEHRGCVAAMPAPACRVDEASTTTSGGGVSGGSTTGEFETGDAASTSGGTSGSSTTGDACDEEGGVDPACELLDPSRPYCISGSCVGCGAAGGDSYCAALDETTPACTSSGTCAPCTEAPQLCADEGLACSSSTGACVACSSHGDCPQSACHLDPADARFGTCFAEASVMYVDRDVICPGLGTAASPNCSLAQAMASTPAGAERVIRLDGVGAAYDERLVVEGDVAIAVLGTQAPRLVGAVDEDDDEDDTLVVRGGTLYMQGVRLVDNAQENGIRCRGATVWLQNSEVRGNDRYGINATGPCDITLERSTVVGNDAGGIRTVGGRLRLDNASVALNGTGDAGPGLALHHTELSMVYSTIAGNAASGADSVACVEATGSIRNSVVVGMAAGSIALDCFSLAIEHSAIDTSLFVGQDNVLVPAYEANWFVSPNSGDLRLAAPPLTPFGGVASWMAGDPTVDADGTPRPQNAPGYAGVDEPGA